MRRAALAAIALVAGLLLLLPRAGHGRSARREPPPTAAFDLPSRAEDPVPDAPGDRAEPAAEPSAIVSGIVTDPSGKPCAGIRLLAVPPDDAAPRGTSTAPGDDPGVPFTHSDADGTFVFAGLPEGEHRLAIAESNWTLEEPFAFRTGMRDLRVVAAAAWCPEVHVRDLATRERISRFLVRYRWPPEATAEQVGEGSDGLYWIRLPRPDLAPLVPCTVEADGYRDARTRLALSGTVTWLLPLAEPRVTLRVVFEDGEPCEEDATAILGRWGGSVTLPAVPAGPGRYRVAVPPGSWSLEFRPAHSWGEPCKGSFDLADGEHREVFLRLAKGGNVVVKREPWDGKPWSLMVGRESGITTVLRITEETWEARHMRPGRYTFARMTDPEGWTMAGQREVEVTTGSRHALTIE